MDFNLSEEQRLLAESVERFIQNDYDFAKRQKIVASADGMDRSHWKTFADLGWLGVPFSEEDGGFGGGPIEVMVLMERFGRGIVVEPYITGVLLAGRAIALAGDRAQKERWLAAIIDGSKLAAFASAEPGSRFDLTDVSTTATADGDGWRLNGHKAVVVQAVNADFLVVSARTSGNRRDRDGVSLFIVESNAAGLTRRDYATVDEMRASEVMLNDVRVGKDALLGAAGSAAAVLERVTDEATLAVGAEAVGAMEVLYKSTVDYTKQRQQFGQPISQFQVLQHRMVDMFMEAELSKSLMFMAAMRMAEGYDDTARRAISALKVQVGKSGRFVAQNAVQLHGGMGMTEELAIGHYFKRMTVIDAWFGNTDHHLRRFGSIAA
jgi:alkylation response protein AidB-like acyl-CoA dehydrogenase